MTVDSEDGTEVLATDAAPRSSGFRVLAWVLVREAQTGTTGHSVRRPPLSNR